MVSQELEGFAHIVDSFVIDGKRGQGMAGALLVAQRCHSSRDQAVKRFLGSQGLVAVIGLKN